MKKAKPRPVPGSILSLTKKGMQKIHANAARLSMRDMSNAYFGMFVPENPENQKRRTEAMDKMIKSKEWRRMVKATFKMNRRRKAKSK